MKFIKGDTVSSVDYIKINKFIKCYTHFGLYLLVNNEKELNALRDPPYKRKYFKFDEVISCRKLLTERL